MASRSLELGILHPARNRPPRASCPLGLVLAPFSLSLVAPAALSPVLGSGMLAYYAKKVAEQDLIAIVMAVSPEFVSPFGGKQGEQQPPSRSALPRDSRSLGWAVAGVFGTNPLTWGVPSSSADGPCEHSDSPRI